MINASPIKNILFAYILLENGEEQGKDQIAIFISECILKLL